MLTLAKRIRRLVVIACERARRRARFQPQLQALHEIAELVLDGQRQIIIFRNPIAANAALGAATDAIAKLMERLQGTLQPESGS